MGKYSGLICTRCGLQIEGMFVEIKDPRTGALDFYHKNKKCNLIAGQNLKTPSW